MIDAVDPAALFSKSLQIVTNKIHATSNIDEIMLEVSADICMLFNADRLTVYSMGEDKQSIVSKLKTGLNSFKDLKLPIAEHSIAGYVALSKKMINIKDCYDDAELKSIRIAFMTAIAPTAMHSARTTGFGGFELGIEASYTAIDSGQSYWVYGTQGAATPEASAFLMMGTGIIALWQLRRRRTTQPC